MSLPGPSARILSTPSAPIQRLVELVPREERDKVISFGQGVPFFGPPREVVEAMSAAAGTVRGYRYSPDVGYYHVREAVARKLRERNGFSVDPGDQVMLTAGANQAFLNAVGVIADPGDEVVLLRPHYFDHEMTLRLLDVRPAFVDTGPDYLPDVEAIRAAVTERTRAVTVVSPNNPTGMVYPEEVLQEIVELCLERDLYLISDEPYEDFLYDGARHVSPASLPGAADVTFSMFSFSKSFGVPGWRLGYLASPPGFSEELTKVQDAAVISASSPAQLAALKMLETGERHTRAHMPRLENNRRVFLDAIEDMGDMAGTPVPTGAFYLFPKLNTRKTGLEVATRLVKEHRVLAVNGEPFGARHAALRLSYGNTEEEEAKVGLERLRKGLKAVL